MNIIKLIRLENNITQTELAKIINDAHITRGETLDKHVGRWERGEVYPGRDIREFLSERYNIPLYKFEENLRLYYRGRKIEEENYRQEHI